MNTTLSHTTTGSLADRIASIFRNLNENRLRYRTYRNTVRELDSLDDRELADLGLHRAMIETVAMEAAYGK